MADTPRRIRSYVFSLKDDGYIELQMHLGSSDLSEEDLVDVQEWVDLIKRQMARGSVEAKAAGFVLGEDSP